ncbi:hypothetical protein [Spirosoma endophyticum]|uniref:Uncharacterized protein n=1 Tax=Spirosoma endophyticum TaxID=662367 RepID=A0A1I2EYM9_9BACT|nr:hypothetical protein [Spirosoma endophyticum]SFE97576.1 hypothetical protein SAMN05216167_12392 [Spirosoma endophyticum]
MKTTVLGSGAYSPGEKKPEQILTDWLTAAALFHGYYHQVVSQASQQVHQANLRADTPLVQDQASRQPLLTLVMAMQAELATLLQDMDQLALLTQAPTPRGYQKLAAHTEILTRLTQQAQARLAVGTSPLK